MNSIKKAIFASIALLSISSNIRSSIMNETKQRALEIAKLENDQYPFKKNITIEIPDCEEDVYVYLNYSSPNLKGPQQPISQRFLITPTNKKISIELLSGFADQVYLELILKNTVEKQLAYLKSQPIGVKINTSESFEQSEKNRREFQIATQRIGLITLDEINNGEAISLPYPFKKKSDETTTKSETKSDRNLNISLQEEIEPVQKATKQDEKNVETEDFKV